MTGTSARWRALRAAAVAVLGLNVVGVLVYTTAVGAWPLAQQKDMLSGLFLATVYGVVGVVIVLRRPSVPIGWLLLVSGALWSGGVWTIWPLHVVDTGGHLHGLAAVAADDQWLPWPIVVVPAVQLTLLLLPDGHLRSRRWRPVAAASVAAGLSATIALTFIPGSVDTFPQLHHPGIGPLKPELVVVLIASAIVLFACAVAGVAGLVAEYRHARDLERQQLRWLALGGLGVVLSLSVGAFTPSTGWTSFVSGLGLGLIPVTVGIAVLRYRLYDLGTLVSRTASYIVLTGALAGVYAAVAALGGLVAAGSSVGVAAGTLVAAALFQPLRRRIQHAVDRRFNRARYDARRTVEAFSVRMRDTVSADSVTRDLVEMTQRVLEPAAVSVWLRPRGDLS